MQDANLSRKGRSGLKRCGCGFPLPSLHSQAPPTFPLPNLSVNKVEGFGWALRALLLLLGRRRAGAPRRRVMLLRPRERSAPFLRSAQCPGKPAKPSRSTHTLCSPRGKSVPGPRFRGQRQNLRCVYLGGERDRKGDAPRKHAQEPRPPPSPPQSIQPKSGKRRTGTLKWTFLRSMGGGAGAVGRVVAGAGWHE